MKIAIAGLGRMGSQIAQKLFEGGYEVMVHNRSIQKIEEMRSVGVSGSLQKEDIVNFFGEEINIIWIMIPAEVVDEELDSWLKIVPKGSVLIDGGNSNFKNTIRRAKKVEEAGSVLLDIGTSGGVWGYKNGFSMMVGGDRDAFEKIESLLVCLANPKGAYKHFGSSGSGHYVKMVHNAIEYGMMESFAEGYRLLKEGHYKDLDLISAGEVWQNGSVIASWLNELITNALKEKPDFDKIDGFVAESGEARWALEVAKEKNIEMPSIQASFDVRLESQKGKTNFATKMLALTRNAFGGHKINEEKK
ncbi:MAG: decarboxylating 6-phosphogluconate dehydrogenase [Candidatus Pacebacteria bacterium]|nr:decarboxylating 6-phosphogluconate dehydrogenase [Candidatus Paceibacterota bacterium]MCF7863064.1 decarboxylating 6-phosphogluconate dehydrogenase [Candidatus Paceibacterota bacterium]